MEELESQLDQMKAALLMASEEDKPSLEFIIKDLENLIQATSTVESMTGNHNTDDDADLDEYSKFQAEIAALDESLEGGEGESGNSNSNNCISDEVAALEGMKCLAPHEESWGQIGYYSAMISQVVPSVHSDTSANPLDVAVRVVFLQPVVKSQLLCPFLKEDKCRFSEDECRFSHGEIVNLSSLREYSEPDYSKIIPGARVLAKYSDELWYIATINRLTEDGNCVVEFDKHKEFCEVGIHETVPLSDDNDLSSDSELSEGEDNDVELLNTEVTHVECDAMLTMNSTDALGDWEKYTTGIGSKLMMKMGYIMGTGLGKNCEGRVNPVDAVIVPPGMSLDKWIKLKKKAGGNSSSFSVEKRMKKAQRQHANTEKQLENQRKKDAPSLFEFLNTKLSLKKNTKSNPEKVENINKQSVLKLNQKLLQLGDSSIKVSKDISKVRLAMKRLEGRDATSFSRMKAKLIELEKQQHELSVLEKNVANEQKYRKDKRKLTEF